MVTTRHEYNYKKVNRSLKSENAEDYKEIPKASVIFEPGLVPTQRQAYYQVSNILLINIVTKCLYSDRPNLLGPRCRMHKGATLCPPCFKS